jgi:hypothetical protein
MEKATSREHMGLVLLDTGGFHTVEGQKAKFGDFIE